ncbi:MAG: hypothetical protein H0U43_09110 [Chthoniobacterales bacterium]|nr:hypothetical protein [Chthoniobacterales bacterium]
MRGVVIVADWETALRLKGEHSVLQFATLNGEFISTAGVVFGGSTTTAAESLLGRKSLISETDAHISKLQRELRAAQRRRDKATTLVEAARTDLTDSRARHQAAHVSRSNSAAQLLLLGHEERAAEERLRQLTIERTTLEQQTGFADHRISELEQELEHLTAESVEQQSRRATAADASEQARLQEEETSSVLQELRLAVATERQRQENLVSQRQPMAAREAELAELIEARRADIANYERRLESQQIESEQAEASLESQAAELAAAEENVAGFAQERSTRLAAVNSLETELRGVRNSLNELHDSRGKEQVRQTQLLLRVENLVEHVTRRYHVDLREISRDQYAFQTTLRVQLKRRAAGILPASEGLQPSGGSQQDAANSGLEARAPRDTSDASVAGAERDMPAEVTAGQLEAIIAELTRQLDNMGPVNLDAVQEYDELEERHRFLETQNNDLTASRKELLDVIAKINSTTQKLFAETFAQVRINFREMFAELFGGGRADLALVDESDALNCGIDIVAKPLGKQLQSVSLLSGGERTMTAVALLFAIYMVRPSPFCILDEMDAPLDESNINRFIKVLDRFVNQSQFIIITHNKRTIAKADVLYGVTMEERGVSKLVGMRLAMDKGADGELTSAARQRASEPQFPSEGAENERELALSR